MGKLAPETRSARSATWCASHDTVDHTKKEYARYEEGRPVIHTNTVEGYFSVFKSGMRGAICLFC